MPRNKKGKLVEAIPEKILRRADAIQYWLQQRDMPTAGTPTWKERLTVLDRMVIGMIEKASEGQASAFNAIMEQGFGKNTETRDVSQEGDQVGAKFNIPKTVSELKKEQDG